MNKQPSKKLNSKQKTIAAVALIVTVLLAICVTFAWYTNRINIMEGEFSLGKFDYYVSLYDVSGTTATQLDVTHRYNTQDSNKWDLADTPISFQNLASNSVKYQVVKIQNDSGFDIKAFEYLTYNAMTAEQTALANYFYFKPYKLNITGNQTETGISSFLSSYTFPTAEQIASPSGEISFGTIKNNAVALENGSIQDDEVSYYLLAYCVKGLPNSMLGQNNSATTISVNPIITIGQSNAPNPQSTASAKVIYADSWQALRSAINSANNGDTVYLTKSVEGPVGTNLSIENGVNLHLNGYNLRIHGDLVFNYNVTDARKLTVPPASKLYVDGDIHVDTLGPFSINSTGSSENIFLGVEDSGNVTGGHLYANAGLSVVEANLSDLDSFIVDENSGLTISNITIKSIQQDGTYDYAVVTVNGSDTMVKLTSGARVKTVNVAELGGVTDVYLVNYGIITNVNFGNIDYTNPTHRVAAHVENHNTISNLSLKTGNEGAKGFKTAPLHSLNYNTRVINGDGAVTSFNSDYATYFLTADIEPFGASVESSTVERTDVSTGEYTVYLRNVEANSDPSYELITDLFRDTLENFSVSDYRDLCKVLKIVTNNGITLKPGQFANIKTYFESLECIDLSSAAIYNSAIPANALSAATSADAMSGLKEVKLPVTAVSIGDSAFAGTRIESVTISSNVTTIGQDAFNLSAGNTLEVVWDRSDNPQFLSAFDVNRTTIFMDPSIVQNLSSGTYSDAWLLNMYEFYEFKAENGAYYCKYSRDGSTTTGCEIIYYAGAIADKSGDDLIPASLNDGSTNYTITAVNRQAFKKAIIADRGQTTVNVDLSTCTRVGDTAFEGTSTLPLHINQLTLGSVNSIGASAFRYCVITYSNARPNGFNGMVSLGANAFRDVQVSGGILDLHGTSAKCTIGENAFTNFLMNGTYANGNAVLDLSYAASIPGSFATGAQLYCDVLLTNVNSIGSGAFSNAILPNDNTNPTNVVDVRNTLSIGQNAFYNIQCNTFYIGLDNTARATAYARIIGATGGLGIDTVVLDGTFKTGNQPALASSDENETITIDNLKIARKTNEGSPVTTVVPAYAFATDRTVDSGTQTFTMQTPNLTINNVITSETSGGDTVYASFTIGVDAFRGTGFSATEKNFEGVTQIGAEAFASSTIVSLNLGSVITDIEHWNFIQYCDSIRLMTIATNPPTITPAEGEEADYSEYMINLDGPEAVATFSSTGTKLANFNIELTQKGKLLNVYISEETSGSWYGWRNYFSPMIYTQVVNNVHEWSYYVVEPGTPGKGIHIVDYKYLGSESTIQSLAASTAAYQLEINVLTGVSNVPGYSGTYNTTEFGEDEDILHNLDPRIKRVKITFGAAANFLQHINAASLQSSRIKGLGTFGARGTYRYDNTNYLLYYRNSNQMEIVKVFERNTAGTVYPSNTYTIKPNVTSICKGAFSGNTIITRIKVANPSAVQHHSGVYVTAPDLSYIEEGAFTNSSVLEFDFRNCYDRDGSGGIYTKTKMVNIGENALGEYREKVLDNNGYYYYQKVQGLSIILPNVKYASGNTATVLNMYKANSLYAMYANYDCLTTAEPDADGVVGSSVQQSAKNGTIPLKSAEADVTLSGVQYHIMPTGTEYDGKAYTAKSAQYVAVVTGLSGDTATASTVIIPSQISVKGITYEVIGITDTAFGTNDVLETLILPNRDLQYSSTALAGCSKLGTIQFNDIIAYTENAKNNVAALPTESAKSLIEDSSEDSGE